MLKFLKNLSFVIFLIISIVEKTHAQNLIFVDHSDQRLVKLAEEFAERLKECSGRSFQIKDGTLKGKGIFLKISKEGGTAQSRQIPTESFYIKSTSDQINIMGSSILGVQHGVYDYLEQLGYRFYFPHPDWHIIPTVKNIFLEYEKDSKPVYSHRRIWYASGTDSKTADKNYSNWVKYNKLGGAFQVNTGHTYESIINRNKEEFNKHPEYFALKENGQRETQKTANPKFCFSNRGLIELCRKDVLNQFSKAEKTSKPLQMVSMDPSDGWNTCHCDNCKKLGTTTDRVFYLANEVAKEVKKEFPGKWIGLYAYANHAEPTSIKLQDNIFVLVATAFNKTKYSTDELIKEWGKIASAIGVRDYYGVIAWDWDMPGRVKGGNVDQLKAQIPNYQDLGAIAMSAETNIGWISRGLGHYIASRLLWDPSNDVERITEEFFEKSFGNAKELIRELHKEWSKNPDPVPSDFNLSKWIQLVDEAYRKAAKQDRKRVLNYIYYLHYVVLFKEYKEYSSKTDPHKAYLNLLNYVWRIKDMEVCASFPLIRRIAGSRAPLKEYNYKNENCEWKKHNQPVLENEILKLFKEDKAKFQPVMGVSSKSFSANMRKVENSKAASYYGNLYRGGLSVFLKKETSTASFEVSMGYVSTAKKEGSISIYEINENKEILVETRKIPMDKEFHAVIIEHSAENYKVTINDFKGGLMVRSHDDTPLSLFASGKSKINSSRRSNFYFYVPDNIDKFIIQRDGPITLKTPNGAIMKFENNKSETVEVKPKANDGGIWEILNQSGSFYFIGIPPFVSISGDNFLVPENIE